MDKRVNDRHLNSLRITPLAHSHPSLHMILYRLYALFNVVAPQILSFVKLCFFKELSRLNTYFLFFKTWVSQAYWLIPRSPESRFEIHFLLRTILDTALRRQSHKPSSSSEAAETNNCKTFIVTLIILLSQLHLELIWCFTHFPVSSLVAWGLS